MTASPSAPENESRGFSAQFYYGRAPDSGKIPCHMPTDAAPTSPPAETPPLVVEESERYIRVAPPSRKFDGLAVRSLFETAMQRISQRDLRLLIDLTGVDLVTSGAMGMFVTIRKKFLSTGGQLHIAAPDPQVMQQFELLNLQRVLHLFTTVDEAVARFK